MTILRTMRNFSSMNIAASILLFVAAIAAAIIANSPVAPVYQEFLLHELHLQIGNFNLLSHGGENLCGKSGIGHSNGNGYCFFVRGIKSVGKPCAVEPEDISDGFCGS